jgi:pSer/pThr/pTyr-binding forkhead associated (FHA) protein
MNPVTVFVQMHGRLVGQAFLKDRLTIGRIPDNNLVLAQPQIAGHHLEIHLTCKGVVIYDMGSGYGTFMAGNRLHSKFPQPWLAGELVQIGSCTLIYQSSGTVLVGYNSFIQV